MKDNAGRKAPSRRRAIHCGFRQGRLRRGEYTRLGVARAEHLPPSHQTAASRKALFRKMRSSIRMTWCRRRRDGAAKVTDQRQWRGIVDGLTAQMKTGATGEALIGAPTFQRLHVV